MYFKLFSVEFFLDRSAAPKFHILRDGPGEIELFAPGWSLIVSY